ncbi:MAG: hypothetical protein JRN26_00980 [Nitrososphaerota archaeon]|jgi:ABC-type transport system involved in multi-copper enzyme maturation permease subunit|nr:hypothetical protein [Nitrososphaerota archaeon]MDG6928247.1 hypothetical protein [Nitrososphaerota archaeon]MDG6930741.1 hypothetical protein [Nitrososphaerota archaeon]MDG6931823.1 hypothetical protein [Nitrososphaerota archaeon]MDG6935453.1 hypothetical protein [Nitrososphaerota archaeon]
MEARDFIAFYMIALGAYFVSYLVMQLLSAIPETVWVQALAQFMPTLFRFILILPLFVLYGKVIDFGENGKTTNHHLVIDIAVSSALCIGITWMVFPNLF